MEKVGVLIKAIDKAIRDDDLEGAREKYGQLVKEVGADTTRDGFTQDLNRQAWALRRINTATELRHR